MMKQSPLNQVYPNVNWAVLFNKLGALLKKDYDWSEEVAALKLQAMIVFGDADAVRPTHIVEFYGLLGGGQKDAGLDGCGSPADQLAILPGLTHYNLSASPLLPTVVAPFLDAQSAPEAPARLNGIFSPFMYDPAVKQLKNTRREDHEILEYL